MNYKKLTIYSVIINILMNAIFFIDNTFLTDNVGYYIFVGILFVSFIFYYLKRYNIKYTKDVIKKDILVAVLWIILSFILGYILMEINVSLTPKLLIDPNSMPSCLIYMILATINMLYALLILSINAINLFLKKTGLSDTKNILISIPTGSIIYLLVLYIVTKILQIV